MCGGRAERVGEFARTDFKRSRLKDRGRVECTRRDDARMCNRANRAVMPDGIRMRVDSLSRRNKEDQKDAHESDRLRRCGSLGIKL